MRSVIDLSNDNYRNETPWQRSTNQGMAVISSKQARDRTSHLISTSSFSSQDIRGGVVKIVPSDVDVSVVNLDLYKGRW